MTGAVIGERARIDSAVVADVELAAGDHRRVLVRMCAVVVAGALERLVREAVEAEVPVRGDRVPARAAVLGLINLFQAEVDMVIVGRVDGEELVVPGLDAGAIALADPADLLRGAAGLQLLRGGDLGPGSGGIAVVG